VRRIEAITGEVAMQWLEGREKSIAAISSVVKSSPEAIAEKVQQLMDKSKALEKELERLHVKLASSAGGELASQAVDIDGVKVLAVKLDGVLYHPLVWHAHHHTIQLKNHQFLKHELHRHIFHQIKPLHPH
jgi:alanyl-tRNA synthetase